MNLSQILIRPVLTEKSVHQEVNGKYTFEVHHDASKVDIKNALKALYGVHVDAVNVTHILAKNRLGKGRKSMEKRSAARRAIVTLKKGEKLDLNKAKKTETKKAKTASATGA
ncbi:MAG: 50S ribosomal protein L23 [Candidatus Peregrinibacteria bacterium GW2011_GWA2_47_7]|nr:MAG: 50S ribosomal protein L23 [Candidatus Peregrinibacteria bacterium GW2011_GWA2_47_7]